MNTTVNVNLAGQHFYFDQAAKVKLEVYFEEIKSYFTDESFLQELMTDVEARIAELPMISLSIPNKSSPYITSKK